MAGESLRIKGDIIANEDLRFEGRIEGTISVPEHTLVVGAQAHIAADVQARAIVVSGTLTGTVTARERFELQQHGNLEGTLEAPRVAIHDGGFLRAHITMPDRPRAAAPAGRHERTEETAVGAGRSVA